MTLSAQPPHTLPCILTGSTVGALSSGLLLWGWPATPGVAWRDVEQLSLLGIGAIAGAVVGALLGLGSRRAGPTGAAVAGLVPAAIWGWVPAVPKQGRVLIRMDPETTSLLLGAALVAWGLIRLTRRPAIHAGIALFAAAHMWFIWPSAAPSPPATTAGPSVLLITVDTTRADLVPGFGGDLEPADMPFMSAWSTSTRRFTRAYAPTALTGPSHTSILSGQHVLEHQILANGRTIPEDTPWVPERLHAAGWFTRAWVSAAVLDARLGFHRGFRVYDSKFDRRLVYGHPLLAWVPRRRVGGTGFTRADPHTVDHVIHSPSPEGRTFTWVHLYGPHWPYTPDDIHADALGIAPTLDLGRDGPVPLNHKTDLSERTRNHAVALYRAELRTLDDQLKRLLTSIPEETRVVVVADHGESLDEHGLFFNHGRLSTAPSTRVPLWVRGPGYPTGTDDRTVSLHQLAPTLLHLADEPHEDMGVALHETSADAVSVSVSSAAVFEAADAPHPHSLGDLASVAVRSGQMSKTASVWHAPGWSQLSTDPRELWGVDDVADDTDATAGATATVTQIEAAWRHAISTPLERSAPASGDGDAETKAALEALGYIEGQ